MLKTAAGVAPTHPDLQSGPTLGSRSWPPVEGSNLDLVVQSHASFRLDERAISIVKELERATRLELVP